MALVLKQNATYTYKGLNVPDPYLVIDTISCSKNPNYKQQVLTVNIYTSQSDRNNDEMIIFSKDYNVRGEDWETYFNPRVMINNHNSYSKSYEYIKQVQNEDGTLEWADWEDLV